MNDAQEEMGQLIDRLDNFTHALAVPFPPAMHVDTLKIILPDLVSEMKAAFVKLTNQDPWGLHLDNQEN